MSEGSRQEQDYQEGDDKRNKYKRFHVVVIAVTEWSLGHTLFHHLGAWVPQHPSVSYVKHRRGHHRREHVQHHHDQDQGRSRRFSKQASTRKRQSSVKGVSCSEKGSRELLYNRAYI